MDRSAVVQKVRDLGRLEKDWDSYGAPKIDSRIIQAVVDFVESMPTDMQNPNMVVPLSWGGVSLEWLSGPVSLEFDFNVSTVHYLAWHPAKGIEEEETVYLWDEAKLFVLIRWFSSMTMQDAAIPRKVEE